jgi:alditol oxidase
MTDGTRKQSPRIGSFSSSGGQFTHSVPTTNWAGNVSFGAARVHQPESIDSLRRIVGGSIRVRALGRGHSFSRIVATTDDLVLLNGLPEALSIDSTNSTATVASHMNYTELVVELQRAGYALANIASIPEISIAGACATGTHGSGDDQRVLAASVAALQLVNSDGDLVEIRRDAGDRNFCGSVVTLGALGIMTRITLDIEPTYDMSQTVYVDIPLDEIHDRLDDVFAAGRSVSVFTDWHSGQARVWVKRRVDQPGRTWTAPTRARHRLHPVPGVSPDLCTEQLGVVGRWHERLAHFRPEATAEAGHELQSEVFVPRALARPAMAALRQIASFFAPLLLVSEIRTVRADDLWLSPAYGRDSVAFHFTWNHEESAVLSAVDAIEKQLMPVDPRPHWGKITAMAPRKVIASYERAPDFERLMSVYDPTFKFRNDFVNGLFPVR